MSLKLPEEYVLAREIYNMIACVPIGQKISRNEINMRLRAQSNDKKIGIISKVLRSMLLLDQIQKRMHRESCQVVFWATASSTERGEQIFIRDGEEQPTNYLVDPPPPKPAPTPAPLPVPPKVVPPPEPESLLTQVKAFLNKRETGCTLRVLLHHFPLRKQEVIDLVHTLWQDGELGMDSTSSRSNVYLWLPHVKTSYVNDVLLDTSKEDETEKEEDTSDDEEFYMMRDLKSKRNRVLLRPTGDTIVLTVEEIEWIKKLKKPYVTL
jgi:hypothetical protein